MAQNLVVNGVIYNGVESLDIPNTAGEEIRYVELPEQADSDTDNNVQISKLWENASDTSTFAAQTVGVNLLGYDAVSIYYKNKNDDTVYLSTGIIPIGKNFTLHYMTEGQVSQRRAGSVSSGGVTFAGGFGGTAANDACAIPVIIYGYKGIKDVGLEAAKMYELPNEMTFDGTAGQQIDTGVRLFDVAKDFTIFMDATAVPGNYNLCLLGAARNADRYYRGGIQVKTNPSWEGDGFTIRGKPSDGAVQVFPVIKTTERTKLAVVYVQGVPSKFYYRTASAAGVVSQNPDSNFGSWEYVQHDGTAYIGGTSGNSEYFIGTIHACEIYSMVLPENEINKRLAF